MTATTSPMDTRRGRALVLGIRAAARMLGSLAAAAGSRWSAFVDSGQLGPSAGSVTSRHTGARI